MLLKIHGKQPYSAFTRRRGTITIIAIAVRIRGSMVFSIIVSDRENEGFRASNIVDCQRCPNTALCELIVCLHVNVELVQLRQLFLSQKPDEMLFPKEVGFANVHLLGYLHDALLLSSLFGTVDEPGARQVAPRAVS